jgi:predicted TIM-barrel fold metal-dependent hydrolase
LADVDIMRVNFPPNPNPGKPKLIAPPGSWDTHFHVFAPHLFPYASTRRYTPPAAPVEHLLAVSSAIGLSRGVIVQPSVHGTDTRVTVDSIAKSDGRLRGLIRDDLDLSLAEMRRLHRAGVRGVRFSAVETLGDHFDPASFKTIVARIADLNWVVDLHLDETSVVQHEKLFAEVQAPLIIDAWARVDPRNRETRPSFASLSRLLVKDNVYLKLTAANRTIARGTPFEILAPMLREFVDAAPDRVIWGTDWPHADVFEPGKQVDDADLLDMLLDLAPDEKVRHEILVDTPKKLFDWS